MKNQNNTYWLIFICFLPIFSCAEKPSKKLPNVILIMADDMGVEALECYGNTRNKTPNINAMATEGILFENCISQPLCTPSRVKLMTGLYNYRNYDYFGYLNSNQETIGNLFQDKGYATCIAGKWQLNGLNYKDEITDWDNSSRPNDFGFDEYCLWQLTQEAKKGGRFANPLIEQNGKLLPRDKEEYGPDVFSEFILSFIEKNKSRPFFAYYPMVLVHDPFVPTPDSEDWNDESKRYVNDTSYFKDMVEYADKIVGKIQNKLKELNIVDETILIFTADNGTHPTIYSITNEGIVQGGKGKTTNAGTHVPFIVSWGDKIKTPFNYDGLIEFSDFFATFSDLTGNNYVNPDGKSFLKVLNGDKNYVTRETALVHYDPKWGNYVNKYRNRFVRNKKYKLYQDGSFYNLDLDEFETNPLSDEQLSLEEQKIKEQLEGEMLNHPKWQ